MQKNKLIKYQLFAIFAASGFSGLIYESIWTHYLKLVLGHAAHSQTLVLAIFMGGMAIGAWLISKKSRSLSNPILVYAVIELIIGMMALFFHKLFIASQGILYEDILTQLQSPYLAASIRWSWAALLILPQSILLGATFPLMSAGIVRIYPNQTGSILAMLYFTNSIGAAIGVLVSGFVLIGFVGLPGTILTAGVLNILLALFVWSLTKTSTLQTTTTSATHIETADRSFAFTRHLLVAAFLTGLASFFYEIGWIRMLNLVLGTTTQSFELMLSAFITGIAFGGLWIRKHIDKIKNTLLFVGYVQIIMGLLAVSTLLLYNSSFDFMAFMLNALQRNETGYSLFISSSHLIAFIIMVPTTFMAGMTLPLFTFSYMKAGYGEKGIGRIYAANTLGAISGIFIAVHIIMPLWGMKNLISLGAFIDLVLGLALIYLGSQKLIPLKAKALLATAFVTFALISVVAEFDEGKMASGVYRTGKLDTDANNILFHKDGKTSTVAVEEDQNHLTISTNGKPDAGVMLDDKQLPAADEPTMILLSALPLAAYPDAQTAAVIGMGSGISSNTLLKTDRLKTVDTIEIEKAMVEGARYFKQHSELVYSDPRSHIHIDDAKSFFSVNNKQYDLIISEPSNPWVSGVASLFTREFYAQIKPHLNDGGIFVQWIQAYEINLGLISSIFKALSSEFDYYVVYKTAQADMVILAADDDKILQLDSWIFTQNKLEQSLHRVDINSLNDLYTRRIGTKKSLDPIFNAYPNQVNSDFFPSLSRQAPKTRYLKQHATEFLYLPISYLPVMDFIDPLPVGASRLNTTPSSLYEPSLSEQLTGQIYELLLHNTHINTRRFDNSLILTLRDLTAFSEHCQQTDSLDQSLLNIALLVNLYLPTEKTKIFWDSLLQKSCAKPLKPLNKLWLEHLKAVGQQNNMAIKHTASQIVQLDQSKLNKQQLTYVYLAAMSVYISEKRYTEAYILTQQLADIFGPTHPLPLNAVLLQALMQANIKVAFD